eukprot:7100991-Lingulodinium_polyedra.AAC.1
MNGFAIRRERFCKCARAVPPMCANGSVIPTHEIVQLFKGLGRLHIGPGPIVQMLKVPFVFANR